MNKHAASKRIDVEFMDAARCKEMSYWTVPLVFVHAANKIRSVSEQLLGITVLRRIDSRWRPGQALPR